MGNALPSVVALTAVGLRFALYSWDSEAVPGFTRLDTTHISQVSTHFYTLFTNLSCSSSIPEAALNLLARHQTQVSSLLGLG